MNNEELKTYNVVWTERMSVNIEEKSENEAVDKVWNSEYDENGVSSEMDSSIVAYLMPKLK